VYTHAERTGNLNTTVLKNRHSHEITAYWVSGNIVCVHIATYSSVQHDKSRVEKGVYPTLTDK